MTPMVVRPLVLVGRGVAPAPLDGDVDGQAALGVERGDVQVGVEDLDVGGELQVAGGDVAGPRTSRRRVTGSSAVHPDSEVLQVQDDVGDVLLHAGQGGELVQGVVEADLGDRRAGDRRQQGAAQRVAERVAEAGLERADGEPLAVVLLLADGLDGRSLDDEHATGSWVASGAECLGSGAGSGYLE